MRGGKRRGAGRKTGSSGIPKTRLKPDSQKRVVRKLYQWTPDEYARIQQAVETSGVKESKIVQTGTLKEVESILHETTNGEQPLAGERGGAGEQGR